MLSLEKYSGLPIEMKDDYSLKFGSGLDHSEPLIRDFPSIKNYLKNPLSTYWRRDVYCVYREVSLSKDRDKILNAKLSFNITVIPPGKIGDEFAKTVGHYHPNKAGTSLRFPEVFEVIFGKAFFVLQSASADLEKLKEIYLIEAKRGEKVVVPPGFGHACINPSPDEVLIVANWQAAENEAIHEPYEAKNGAAYYAVESESLAAGGKTVKECKFVPNLSYSLLPQPKRGHGRELPKYDLLSAIPMYFTATRNLQTLDFLVNPENYLEEIVPEKLFKTISR